MRKFIAALIVGLLLAFSVIGVSANSVTSEKASITKQNKMRKMKRNHHWRKWKKHHRRNRRSMR